MADPKPEIRERSLKNQSEILRALRAVTQKRAADLMGVSETWVSRLHDEDLPRFASLLARAADLMGVSETWVSRLHDEDLPRFASLLAACGLKVVSEAHKTYPPERIAALTTLAREALDREGPPSAFGGEL